MSDTELWQAWRERGDAEAFTTLVERYLDMVYATARRILGNTHDAEDVAQDCFIALLKGRVKVKHPLGPWLHCVARNRALDRIKGETRRRDRDRAWQQEQHTPSEASIDDILQHVDDAIDALPADLRTAIVGRFLEGKTNAALGQACGVGESTIRLRVNNGVSSIRETLKHRGIITTAAALGALLETNLSSAAPTTLRHSIAKLTMATPAPAKGALSTGRMPVAVLATAAVVVFAIFAGPRILSGSLDRSAVVAVTTAPIATKADTEAASPSHPAALSLASAAAPSRLHSESTEPLDPVVPEAEPEEPEEPTSTLSGTVHDHRGYPLPGAIVTVASHGYSYELQGTQVFAATTDANGAYTVSGIQHRKTYWGYSTRHSSKGKEFSGLIRFDPPNRSSHLQVWVSAEGYRTMGEQNVPVEAGSTKREVDFTLSPGVGVRGRVCWPDGQPLKRAAVILHGALDTQGRPQPGWMEIQSTDENGEYLFGLNHEGTIFLQVVAANGQPAVFTNVPATIDSAPLLTMPEPAALSGTIRRADGTPLVHAGISVQGRVPYVGDDPDFARQIESYDGRILAPVIEQTYTDEQGNFKFPVFAAVADAVLFVSAPLLEDGAQTERLLAHHIGPLPGGEATRVDVVLPGERESMTLAISVIGIQTGKPLPHTSVHIQKLGDEHGLPLPAGFESPHYPVTRNLSDPGTYALWPYYNNRPHEGTRALYGQELPWAPGTEKSITFRIPEPFTLSARIVDPMGDPIPGAEVAYISDGSDVQRGISDEEGRFEWNGFAPGGPGYMRASKEGYTTNEFPAIFGEPGATYPEQTIVLVPTGGIEGRMLAEDGSPLANTIVQLLFELSSESFLRYQVDTNTVSTTVNTEADGSFVWLDGVPATEGSFSASLVTRPQVAHRSTPISITPEPGAVLQLGPITLTPPPEHNEASPQ